MATVVATGMTGTSPAAAASDNAMAILVALDRQERIAIGQVRDESPTVVVEGLCHELAAGGCKRAVHTKDASMLVFGSAEEARAYAGAADDDATALGRTVVSFGSPARMGDQRQSGYVSAVRAYRRAHAQRPNDLGRMLVFVMGRGLPMRTSWVETDAERAGLAASVPGAADMATSKQVDVIVFESVAAARDYAGGADDQTYRRGRVVLSFGNPALLGRERQERYSAALRDVLS